MTLTSRRLWLVASVIMAAVIAGALTAAGTYPWPPGPASIDWRGVRAVSAPPEPFAGVRVPKPRCNGAEGPAEAPGAPAAVLAADYLTMAPVAALRAEDDDGSL